MKALSQLDWISPFWGGGALFRPGVDEVVLRTQDVNLRIVVKSRQCENGLWALNLFLFAGPPGGEPSTLTPEPRSEEEREEETEASALLSRLANGIMPPFQFS